MHKEIRDYCKNKLHQSEEVKEFMKTVKDDEFYKVPVIGKAIKGSRLKQMYYGKK